MLMDNDEKGGLNAAFISKCRKKVFCAKSI